MQKLIFGILALFATFIATAVATPVLAAPVWNDDGHGRFEQRLDHHDRTADRHWQRGQRFDSHYAPDYRVIGDTRFFHLADAPRGYRWVRSGNDAVLIGVTSGLVASVLANAIR